MASKVLFLHGYPYDSKRITEQFSTPYFPLDILHASSFLAKAGLSNVVYDPTFQSEDELSTLLVEEECKYVVCYCTSMTREFVLKVIAQLKKDERFSKLKIVAGGPDVQSNIENYLATEVDVVIPDRWEPTLVELINTFEVPFNPFLDHINGIAYGNALGEITRTPDRDLSVLVEKHRMANWKAVDVDKYLDASIALTDRVIMPIQCALDCFDSYEFGEKRIGAATVIDHAIQLNSMYEIDTFRLEGIDLGANEKWLNEFVEKIDSAEFSFGFEGVIDLDNISEKKLTLLKKAGIQNILIAQSIESLKSENTEKNGAAKKLAECISLIKQHNIQVGARFFMGLPKESFSKLKARWELIADAQPDFLYYGMEGVKMHMPEKTLEEWKQGSCYKYGYSHKFYKKTTLWLESVGKYDKFALKNDFSFIRLFSEKLKRSAIRFGIWKEQIFKKDTKAKDG